MRKLLLGSLFALLATVAQAQSPLTGTIADTLGKKPLHNAVVTIIQQKDSSLVAFTRSDKSGKFIFPDIRPGKYVMLITYPKFADFSETVQVAAGKPTDVGSVAMTLKAKLLDAVVIRSAGSIRIKGDTTEFVADSFRVREGATVEELLRKLPGFQVNSKGEITAQGQRVQKVLVDGEEFFGDDPTAATKNLSAKAVDKVQLFDNKSEQQNITGITSGNEGKTVNIKLKEDQKKGSFGRAELGSDFDRLVDARLLFNRFVGKKKFSVYGTKSNTSTGSLNWEDRRRLGIENDFEYDELSGYYFSFGSGDDFSDWSLRGLPNSYSAGGLFIDKWNADKHSINSSYRYNRLATTNIMNRFEQNLSPDNVFRVNTNTDAKGLNEQHAINAKYEWKLDSLASLKLTVTGLQKDTYNENATESETVAEKNNKTIFNDNDRIYDSRRLQTDNQLQYKQNFKKKNRLLMTTLRFGVTDDKQTGQFNSNIEYRTAGSLDSLVVQDQQKRNIGNSATYGVKLTFSEPLSNVWSLVTELSYNKNNSTSKRNTFEKGTNDKYDIRNPLFSNNFDLDATSKAASMYVRFTNKKIRGSVGSGVSSIRLNLYNLDAGKRSVYNFFNLTPQAAINYTIRPQTMVSLNYRGTTRQPTIDQLQPIRNNEDPLNEYIGNPDLQVGFNHNISVFYNSYRVLSGRGIWANAGINFTENAITQSSVLLSSGKRTYTPVNVEGNHNWYLWTQWNKGEGEKKFIHSVGVEANGGRNVTYVNTARNKNDYYTVELNYGIRYEEENKYRIFISPKVAYNSSRSSLNRELNNNYWSYGGRSEGYLMLPFKIEISTDAEFDLRQQVSAFAVNPNIILWKAEIYRRFFKNKNARIGFVANDILNQNRGFTRIINSDRVYQENFQRISQYFMLKLEWSFNKMGQN